MRLRAKRDANEALIVAYLRRCGMVVIPVSSPGAPDLLCYEAGMWFPVEVKSAKGRLTALQKLNRERAPFVVLRSLDEAATWYRDQFLP